MTASSDLRQDSREADGLARVTLSRHVDPGDARVAALVSELGAEPVVDLVRKSGLHEPPTCDDVVEPEAASRAGKSPVVLCPAACDRCGRSGVVGPS